MRSFVVTNSKARTEVGASVGWAAVGGGKRRHASGEESTGRMQEVLLCSRKQAIDNSPVSACTFPVTSLSGLLLLLLVMMMVMMMIW
jgi:hypothetical protein